MGKQQQQFQVFFSGMVRRALLRKFHTRPPIFSPYRERSTSAAMAAGPRAEGGRSFLHELCSTSSPATQNQICPIPLHCPNPLQSNGCLSPDENTRWKIPSVLLPTLYDTRNHRSTAWNLLTENYWIVTRAGLANRRVYTGRGTGEARGLASLVDKSRSGGFEKADEALAEASAEEGEGPRRDEGVSASVSGREAESHVKKQRRKRKSLIQEVEMADEEVAFKTSSMASELVEAATQFSALDIATASKPTRAPRRKRSKEVLSGETIFRAFNENAEPPNVIIQQEKHPGVLETPVLSTQVKPSPTLKTTEKKKKKKTPVELSSDGTTPSISSPSNDSAKGERRRKSKPENASIASLDNDDRVLSSATEPEDIQLSPESTQVPQLCQATDQTAQPTAGGEALAITDSVDTKSDSHTVSNVKETEAIGKKEGLGETRKAEASSPTNDVEPVPVAFADPQGLYRELLDSKGGRPLQSTDKTMLNSIFYRFASSGWVSDQALSLYINSKFFPSAASKFRRFFAHKSSQELRTFVVSKGPTNAALQFLFPIFAEFCINEFPTEIGRYRELVTTADMTKPDAWYPFARAMRRKIIYHKGPTNSGKTYNALKRYMEAANGIYCSPLRLLAMEVFDTVNIQGIYCNLHTGQEKRDVPFANHLACTVEMCYLTRQWEVAVIDEIQMMSDEYRGWAWTRAFLGLQADEIHVCGDPSALPLIQSLCAGTGDDLVEYEYERFVPLEVAKESLRGDFRNIETGDCIVAFSRRDIFDIKREVELASKHRCCVVYGALPPETRTHQAKLFNTADNGYNVLVASDAIGMGLNLNIRRVVFFALDKFDGDSKKPVPPAQVKQIAGRAGRRGSLYPEGVTTTFFSQDLPYLEHSMQQGFDIATAAGLFPVYEQVELFASQLPNETFAKLLERFSETCRLDGAFFLCRYDNLKRVANMLEKVKGLSLEDRFNFCFAPVNVRDPQSMAALYRYATAFSQKIPVHVEMGVPFSSAKDEFELLDLEARHQVLSMYLWLSQHFRGELFPQKEQAGEMASQIAVLLGQSLVQSSRRWAKRKLVPPHSRGRPYPMTGRLQNDRLGAGEGQDQDKGRSWRDGIAKPAKTFVPA